MLPTENELLKGYMRKYTFLLMDRKTIDMLKEEIKSLQFKIDSQDFKEFSLQEIEDSVRYIQLVIDRVEERFSILKSKRR